MLSKKSHFLFFFLILVGAVWIISPATATDHIVGANKGWNPGMNYSVWANNHTFYVDDFISFRYKKYMHNVFEVNQSDYDKCTTEGAVGNWTSGKDFIPLSKPGRYYFICGNIGGCSNGMKVTILVHPLPPPPSSSITATEHSSSHDKSSTSAATRVVLSGVLLVSFVFAILMECGWM